MPWAGNLNKIKESDDDATQVWDEVNETGYVRAHIPVLILPSTRQSKVKDAHDAWNYSQGARRSSVATRHSQ